MSRYDYKCNVCGGQQEIQKPMGSDYTPTCCEVLMQRIYSAPPIKFNGTGFYSTGG